MPISDFDLHACVDGELTAVQCITVVRGILASEVFRTLVILDLY